MTAGLHDDVRRACIADGDLFFFAARAQSDRRGARRLARLFGVEAGNARPASIRKASKSWPKHPRFLKGLMLGGNVPPFSITPTPNSSGARPRARCESRSTLRSALVQYVRSGTFLAHDRNHRERRR